MMTIKDKIKKEIDQMPDELLHQILTIAFIRRAVARR